MSHLAHADPARVARFDPGPAGGRTYPSIVQCPSCSVEVPAGARICASCGPALFAPADERRIVSMLFGDLVGFTTLSETLDPEHVKNMVDRCFERLPPPLTHLRRPRDKNRGGAVAAP